MQSQDSPSLPQSKPDTALRSGAIDMSTDNKPVSFYGSNQNSSDAIDSLEPLETGNRPSVQDQTYSSAPRIGFSKRKALVASAIITAIVTLITAVGILFLSRLSAGNKNALMKPKSQDVTVQNADTSNFPKDIQNASNVLLVNSDIITRGSLRFSNGTFQTTITADTQASDQTFRLPNSSGTICLNTNNCSFAAVAQVLAQQQGLIVQQQTNATQQAQIDQLNQRVSSAEAQSASGVQSLQGQTGNLSLTAGNGISISGLTIKNTGVTSVTSNNTGLLDVTVDSDGNVVLKPSASGGSVALGPNSAQNDATTNPSLFVNKTSTTGNLLQFGVNGVDKFVVGNNGSLSLGTPLTARYGGTGLDASGAANGQIPIGNGSGFSLATISKATGSIIKITNSAGGITIGNEDINCVTCAKNDLNNLASVSINTSLLPANTGAIDLGSSSRSFRDLYLAPTGTTSPSSNYFKFAGNPTGGVSTLTLPNLSGATATLCATTNNCNYVNLQSTSPGIVQTSGNINIDGVLIAGTRVQTPILKTADSTSSTTSAISLKSGDATAGNNGSGAVNIDAGAKSGSGTTGAILLAATSASGITLGRTGLDVSLPGTLNSQTISSAANFTGTVAIQGSNSLTLGNATTNNGSIILKNGTNASTTKIQGNSLASADTIFQFAPAAAGTYNICTSQNNCAGNGASVSADTPVTTNRITYFNGTGNNITSSILEQTNASTLTVLGSAASFVNEGTTNIQGGSSSSTQSLTLGSQTGTKPGGIAFNNGTDTNVVTLQSGLSTGSFTLKLPTSLNNTGQCLAVTNGGAGIGQLSYSACSGGGGGGGVTSSGSSLDHLARFTSGTNITDSLVRDNGSSIGINTAPGTSLLTVGSLNNFKVTDGGDLTVGGVTNATITASTGLIQSNATGYGLGLVGTPTATSTQSLLRLGDAITNGDASVNGGTYIGLNAPSLGIGSAADFINLQLNGVAKLRVSNAGDITAGKLNGVTFGIGTGNFTASDGTSTLTVSANSTIDQDLSTTSNVGFNSLTLTSALGIGFGGTGTATTPTNGKLLIGNGTNYSLNTLTAGSGVTITYPSAGNITISTSGGGGGSCAGCATRDLNNLQAVAIAGDNLRPATSGAISIGESTRPFGSIFFTADSVDPANRWIKLTTGTTSLTNARTVTFDDLTGSAAIVQTAGSSVAQTGDINVTGSSIANVLQAPSLQSAGTSSASSNSADLAIRSGNASGTTSNSGNVTIDAGTATGTKGSITLGATNASSLTLGNSGLATTVAGNLDLSKTNPAIAATATNSNLLIDANGTGQLQLGGASSAQSVLIGASAGTGNITVGSSSATQSVLIGNGAGVSTVSIGNATTAGSTVNIAGANTASGSTDIVNIATGIPASTGAKVVHIADGNSAGTGIMEVYIGSTARSTSKTNIYGGTGLSAISLLSGAGGGINIGSTVNNSSTSSSVVQIANTANATNAQVVTIGSVAANTDNNTTIQGGSGSGAVSIQAAGSGTISLGTANANTVNIGSTTASTIVGIQAGGGINIGTGNVANTIQIGNTGNAIAQTVNIGNNATASSASTVVIGSLLAASTTTIQGGVTTIASTQGGFTNTLAFPSSNGKAVTYTLPTIASTDGAGQTLCTLQLANCAGAGGGVVADTSFAVGYITKITSISPTNNIGNSLLFDFGTGLGIGTVTPNSLLQITGTTPLAVSTGNGTNASNTLTVSAIAGGDTSKPGGTAVGGTGSAVSIATGNGGNFITNTSGNGGAAGGFTVRTGNGGYSGSASGSGGVAGAITLTAGNGGNSKSQSGINGGAVTITAGNGGTTTGAVANANGGNINLQGGLAGTGGTGGAGSIGSINLQTNGGNVGIGTSSPTASLTVLTAQPSAVTVGNGVSATTVLAVTGGAGGNTSATGQLAGAGSAITLQSGTGGIASGSTGTGGSSGTLTISTGNGGNATGTGATATGGGAGALNFTAGNGGNATTATAGTGGSAGVLSLTAGNGGNSAGVTGINGGSVTLTGGNGGTTTGAFNNANGGNLTIQGGAAGTGGTLAAGFIGNVLLGGSGGNIGIGTVTPTAELQVKGGTIASGVTMTATSGSSTFATSGTITLNAGDFIVPNTTTGQARAVTTGGTGTSFTVSPAFSSTITTPETFTIHKSIFNFTNTTGTSSLFGQGNTGNIGLGTTAPTSKFQIVGTSSLAADGNSLVRIQNSNSSDFLTLDTTNLDNLVNNPGFENPDSGTPFGWSARQTSTLSRDTAQTPPTNGGIATGKLATTANANDGITGTSFTKTVPAGTYTLSFSAKLSSGTMTTLSAGYNQGASDITCLSGASVNTTFARYNCTFTTSANLSNIFIQQTDNVSRTIFIDNVILQTGSSASAFTEAKLTVFSTANNSILSVNSSSGQVLIGSTTNGVSFGSGSFEPTLTGSARHTKKINLTAEYAGAVLDAVVNGTDINIGTMTAGFEGAPNFVNYYNWQTSQTTAQTYDIVLRVPVPSDWSSWTANGMTVKNNVDNTSNAIVSLEVLGTDNQATAVSMGQISSASTPGWTTATKDLSTSNNFVADGIMTIRIRLSAKTVSGATYNAKVGNVTLQYNSKY